MTRMPSPPVAQTPVSPYEARLRRVIRYINDNPEADLSLDALADVAAMSRFHFHRVCHALTGSTASQLVRRLRLHRAAHALAHTDVPIPEVALGVGYDNSQSFARAFKAVYGATPASFRREGKAEQDILTLKTGEPNMFPSEIRDLPESRCAALMHKGAYQNIGRAFTDLATIFNARNLWGSAEKMLGVYYDSPADVPEDELRSAACIRVRNGFEMPDDLTEVRLPGGSHLVVTIKGPYTSLPAAWDYVYCTALPASGRLPGDSVAFELYLNDPSDTAPEDLLTEICVPLAASEEN